MKHQLAAALILATFSIQQLALAKPARLSVITVASQNYTCSEHTRVKAVYYRLSDGSLNFVKLTVKKDGATTRYTLPQIVSASGARYTSEQDVQWWSKGKGGFLNLHLSAENEVGIECR